MGGIAFTFADRRKDWVSEPIAWGEQQIACSLIPARQPDPNPEITNPCHA
jgi:hypothetical protein